MTASLGAGLPFEDVCASEFAGEINTKSKLEKSHNQKLLCPVSKEFAHRLLRQALFISGEFIVFRKTLTESYKYLVKIIKS
jgi:hypothetical protein